MKRSSYSLKQNDVLDLYNKVGGGYLFSMFTNNKWTRYVDSKEKEIVSEYINFSGYNKDRDNILDLGMGPGRWSKFFLEMGFKKVYGLDIAEEMVKSARTNILKKNFYPKVGEIEKIPFNKNYFDYVFCFRAFKYLSDPNKGLKEIRRVIKSDGKFILEFSNKSLLNKFFKVVSFCVLIIYPKLSLESRYRYFQRANFYSKDEMETLLHKNNFKILKYQPLFVLPSIPIPTNRATLKIFTVLNDVLLKLLPNKWFARSWVFLISN